MIRPHAELIHAWADGAEIEYYQEDKDEWKGLNAPSFLIEGQYRIKPPAKKKRVMWQWLYVDNGKYISTTTYYEEPPYEEPPQMPHPFVMPVMRLEHTRIEVEE